MHRMKESIMLKHEYSGRSAVKTNGARCLPIGRIEQLGRWQMGLNMQVYESRSGRPEEGWYEANICGSSSDGVGKQPRQDVIVTQAMVIVSDVGRVGCHMEDRRCL